ncbi:MAG: DUF167 domain-containing protein [Candidatus Methanosuratincola sp.]|nr:DUF167 family protein [Candidatus Methanosuratincola sp.]
MRETKDGIILEILVKPNSKRDSISIEGGLLVVETREKAEQGRANTSVLKQLSKSLGVGTSSIVLLRGRFDRSKSILIRGAGTDVVERLKAKIGKSPQDNLK